MLQVAQLKSGRVVDPAIVGTLGQTVASNPTPTGQSVATNPALASSPPIQGITKYKNHKNEYFIERILQK